MTIREIRRVFIDNKDYKVKPDENSIKKKEETPLPTNELCPLCSAEGDMNMYMLQYFDHKKCPKCGYIPNKIMQEMLEAGDDDPIAVDAVIFTDNPINKIERFSIPRNMKSKTQKLLSVVDDNDIVVMDDVFFKDFEGPKM